jgi:chromate transporter
MKVKKANPYLQLFISFLKIGAFTFGGGYAMIPLIHREVIECHPWIDEKELMDIFAISQITPGVIAVNSATYIGYKIARFWGSFFATLGVVIPSFIFIYIISFFLVQFKDIIWVEYAFRGIRIGVVVLLVYTVIRLMRVDKINLIYIFVISGSFLLATFTELNIIFLLLGAIGTGILYAFLSRKNNPEDGGNDSDSTNHTDREEDL